MGFLCWHSKNNPCIYNYLDKLGKDIKSNCRINDSYVNDFVIIERLHEWKEYETIEKVIKRLNDSQSDDFKGWEDIEKFISDQDSYTFALPLYAIIDDNYEYEHEYIYDDDNIDWVLLFGLYLDNPRLGPKDNNNKKKLECDKAYFYVELQRRDLIYKDDSCKESISECFVNKFSEYPKNVPEEDRYSNVIEIELTDLKELNSENFEEKSKKDAEEIIYLLDALKKNGKEFIDCFDKKLLPRKDAQMELNRRENQEKIDKYIQCIVRAHQIIFYGPPGTGKTYLAKEIVARILETDINALAAVQLSENLSDNEKKIGEKGAWDIIQFHPSYNYEDFVRGIAVSTEGNDIKYTTKNRIFAEMCAVASKSENGEKKFCLIIDEINRADLASVLGELIYALEYRGEAVRTPYAHADKEKTGNADSHLTIPDNLYIIGTMNTADRSIGHIDYAVRRRFAFEQILPDKNMVHKFAQSLFKDTVKLFGEEAAKFYYPESQSGSKLSSDYHWEDVLPGHSYFMVKDVEKKKDDEIKDELAFKFKYQVWPLLEEYHKDGILEANPAGNFQKILEQGIVSTDKIKEKRFTQGKQQDE